VIEDKVMQSITVVATAALTESQSAPILPVALIACGLALTVVWTGFIGYGLVTLIGLAF
jgi:hypothetical protein